MPFSGRVRAPRAAGKTAAAVVPVSRRTRARGGFGRSVAGARARDAFFKADGPDVVWQDREIKFDSPASTLALRDGEFVIDVMTKVEDTKGNNGDAGNLTITNLRVIWRSARSKRARTSASGTLASPP